MSLKDLAAADLAWAMSREETYKSDGAPVPEPIRRLKALASAIQDTNPSLAPALDSAVRDFTTLAAAIKDCGRRLGINAAEVPSTSESVSVLGEVEKLAANGIGAREMVIRCEKALTDAADVILGVQRELGGLFIAGEGPVLSREGRREIELRHGLLLKQRKTGYRALISELKPGSFCYVWVSPDGKSSTDATGIDSKNWFADEWEEISDPIDVKPVVATSLAVPDIATVQPAKNTSAPELHGASQDSAGLIQDWNPTTEEMAKSGSDLRTAVEKAGLKVEIDVPRLVEKFKAEKGTTTAKRPAMAFYHWAVKTLKGG